MENRKNEDIEESNVIYYNQELKEKRPESEIRKFLSHNKLKIIVSDQICTDKILNELLPELKPGFVIIKYVIDRDTRILFKSVSLDNDIEYTDLGYIDNGIIHKNDLLFERNANKFINKFLDLYENELSLIDKLRNEDAEFNIKLENICNLINNEKQR